MEINQAWIDQQRAVCEAATPGPWAVSVANEYPYDDIGSGLTGEHVAICGSKNENTQFIITARTVLPAALDALEAAYVEIARLTDERDAANKPLTLPELFDLADDDAAWVVTENGKIWAMGAECAQEWASEERCLFFASKPTNADIAAARKEHP